MKTEVSETPCAIYEGQDEAGRNYRIQEFPVWAILRSLMNPEKIQRQGTKSLFRLDNGEEVEMLVRGSTFVRKNGATIHITRKDSVKP